MTTYHGQLKRVAAAIIGDAQAEEVVQQSWLAVITNLKDFERRSSLKTWLFSIVMNEAKGRLRKGKRELSLDHRLDGEAGISDSRFLQDGHWAHPPGQWHEDSPEALLSFEDFRRCLEKTLKNLPDAQRSVLTLRDMQGLALEEICNILQLSASNIRVLIHRARTRVYAMIEHFEETGEC